MTIFVHITLSFPSSDNQPTLNHLHLYYTYDKIIETMHLNKTTKGGINKQCQ